METKFLFFYGHHKTPSITASCLSQWYEVDFVVDGVKYKNAEQYMMAEKSRLFNDKETLKKIMNADSPYICKKLGREVRNFNSSLWDKHKYNIVLKGNKAKFSQNPELKAFLLSTGDDILVEASPYDRIWGIGISKQDALSGAKWKGQNLLGKALMETRECLKKQN